MTYPQNSGQYPAHGLDESSKARYNMSDLNGEPVEMENVAYMEKPSLTDAIKESLAPKVAISYVRVSTRGQAERGGEVEGFSIPAQREANRHKAASLGAIVIKEFADRGASARSANRPELQRMLEYIKDHDVDYVIVHKLDRLARNRGDDVEITKALADSQVRLISTTESIDETPSGMLLHGIMSSIAEFYSRNLANEVIKGMTQKARGGGTISKAPLGYRNIRTTDVEGREMRTVIVDEERAPLITWAFEAYATGEWTMASLAQKLADRGLSTRATPRLPSKPMTESYLNKILINPYYKGDVHFQGALLPGKHTRLVDEVTWRNVQSVISSHVSGERTRDHPHFLKSTVYCGSCGSRLLVQIAKSRSGARYGYFMCSSRHAKRNDCQQKSVLIDEVEDKIQEYYRRVSIGQEFRAAVEATLLVELKRARTEAEVEQEDLHREQEKLLRERDKLMQAHYGGAIPLEVLKDEQDRITSAMNRIISQIKASSTHFDVVEGNLHIALDLLEDCATAYKSAPDHIKRLFNQAFFKRILVNPDLGIRAEFAPPFDNLLDPELGRVVTSRHEIDNELQKNTQSTHLSGLCEVSKSKVGQLRGKMPVFLSHGLSMTLMVEVSGLEPPTSTMRT